MEKNRTKGNKSTSPSGDSRVSVKTEAVWDRRLHFACLQLFGNTTFIIDEPLHLVSKEASVFVGRKFS